MTKLNKLNTLALTLLITGAIDSIRNLPAAALFGGALVFFFLFVAVTFLIPTALVAAELASNIDEGGIYQWGRLAFGKRIGFLAVWLQWINNIVWFPTILSFIAGTAVYFIAPDLADNKYYLVGVILAIFWFLTIVGSRGIHMSTKITSFSAVVGIIIPIILIIVMLIAWLILGNPIQIELSSANVISTLKTPDNWVALTTIMLGLSGMELAAVHIKDVNEPQKTFPKALAFSSMIILGIMILGSLAIAFVIPYNQINLVNGTIQAFSQFLNAYHLSWMIPVLTIMLLIGSIGGVISWLLSPIKGLSQAARHGFLPPFFQRENKHGAPQNLLIAQAVLVSIACLAFLFLPSVNASYWLLTGLSAQLYMLMYVIMFLSALRLRRKISYEENTFTIPGKTLGLWLVCLLGILGCSITIFVGFIPPANINIGSKLHYEILFCSGLAIMLIPTLFFYWYQQREVSGPASLGLGTPPLGQPLAETE